MSHAEALVAAGVGITLFPALAVASAREDLVLRDLADPIATRQTYAAVPAGYQTPAATEMLRLLLDISDGATRVPDDSGP